MAIINSTGAVVANNTQPILTFASEFEFNDWQASLSAPEDINKFIIIRDYEDEI